MKASTVQSLFWTATAVAVGVMGWQFYVYWTNRGTVLKPETGEGLIKRIRAPKDEVQQIRKSYQAYDSIQVVNLRGIAPPKPVTEDPTKTETKPTVQYNPLDSILDVRAVQFDPEGSNSFAIVNWKDSQISELDRKRHIAIRQGEWFVKPYEKKWKVKLIEIERVVFESDDGKEATRPVAKIKSPISLNQDGGAGAGSQPATGDRRPYNYETPETTKKLSETEYWLSKRDYGDAQEKGLDVIGRDIQTTPYLDNKTKRPAGLRLKSVRPDSLPDRLGLREGDIVRELNGASIKSTADVYAFAKEHPDVRDVELSVERYGRIVKILYRLPN
ncbi:MAG: hypothetical protein JNJ88_01045 [Planctomycetes bacterium]|nr:hypothetical protein [Planctomycetota bacterium]